MKRLLILLISIFAFSNISAQKYTTKYITDANKVGLEWLSQVNSGQFENAYNKLSSTLKIRFSKENWVNQISLLMDEFGQIQERSVNDTYFRSEIEGLDDGFYVIVEYSVDYLKTKNHTEILILKQSDQLVWEIYDFNYEFNNKEDDAPNTIPPNKIGELD
jgi:hypothetical protein